MDVITFGEAMVRLTPPHYRRLEQAYTLDVEIGGAELNTAVGLSRLGRSVAWASRLTDNPLGRLVANRARETGVNIDHVAWTDADRVGLYFLEMGAAPRPSGIVYDRADSAMARITPGTIDWATAFTDTLWFYVTGITAALSESSAQATLEALQAAREAGLSTALDPNYRAKLWSVEQARDWLSAAIPYVDVLITNPEDLARFFGVHDPDPAVAIREAAEQYSLNTVAVTLRETISVWKNRVTAIGYSGGVTHRARDYEVEIVDRLGSGDAFVAGLLHGLIDGDLVAGLETGMALGALKHSVPGDFPWINASEVEALMQGGGLRISR